MWLSNPSGGIFYHFSALRYSRLWQNTRKQIASRLSQSLQQNLSGPRILIFGASAGYLLDSQYIRNIKELVVVDPDPWAKFLFCLRHRRWRSTRWIRDESLLLNLQSDVKKLENFLHTIKPDGVIFANLLGQLALMRKDFNAAAFAQNLKRALRPYSWLSFHDVYSFDSANKDLAHSLLFNKQNLNELLKVTPELRDHFTEEMFGAHQEMLVWQRLPKTYHLIGFKGTELP